MQKVRAALPLKAPEPYIVTPVVFHPVLLKLATKPEPNRIVTGHEGDRNSWLPPWRADEGAIREKDGDATADQVAKWMTNDCF